MGVSSNRSAPIPPGAEKIAGLAGATAAACPGHVHGTSAFCRPRQWGCPQSDWGMREDKDRDPTNGGCLVGFPAKTHPLGPSLDQHGARDSLALNDGQDVNTFWLPGMN